MSLTTIKNYFNYSKPLGAFSTPSWVTRTPRGDSCAQRAAERAPWGQALWTAAGQLLLQMRAHSQTRTCAWPETRTEMHRAASSPTAPNPGKPSQMPASRRVNKSVHYKMSLQELAHLLGTNSKCFSASWATQSLWHVLCILFS